MNTRLRSRPPAKCRRLQVERLEARQLLDAAGVALDPDAFSVHQNQPERSLEVLANDEFPADYSGQRQITAVSFGSAGGRVRVSDDGQFLLYAPPADFGGTETFTYFVDAQFSAEVTVQVQAPLAPDSYSFVPDGQSHVLDVMANDSFWPDYPDAKQITLVSQTSLGGTLSIASDGKSVLYELPDGAFGKDTFVYIVDDRYPAQVAIEIPDPLHRDEYEIIQHDRDVVFPVTSNDGFWTDYAGDRQITHILDLREGAEATISADGRSVIYSPPADFHGWDRFRYVVDSAFETFVQVIVQRPVRDDYHSVDRNSVDARLNLTGNDAYWTVSGYTRRDIVDRVTWVGEPESGGTVTISQDGQHALYTPPAGFIGQDTFEYLADDKYRATVTVQVTMPVRDDSVTVYQDTVETRLDVLENDFQGNGYTGPRRITQVGETSSGGIASVSSDGQSVLYTPPADYLGRDSFEYVVDGELTANVTLWVQTLVTDDYLQFGEPSGRVLSVLANDHLVPSYPGPAVITAVSETSGGGVVTIAADGKTLQYLPGSGDDHFIYTVDGKYDASVRITYPGRLAGDVFVVDQNSERTSFDVLANDFRNTWVQQHWGTYSGPRVITSVSESESGAELTVSPDGQTVRYRPAADFAGDDRFTYIVDGYLQADAIVHVVRRVRDDQFHVDPDSSDNVLKVLVNDLFGADYRGAGRVTDVTDTAAGGQVTVAGDGGAIRYTPAEGFSGQDTFTYTVDGQLKAEVTVSVHSALTDRFPRFESSHQLQQYLLDAALDRYEYLFGIETSGKTDDYVLDGNRQDSTENFGGPAANDHSETNVQVAGVDEADILETDGNYLYTLHGRELVITKAWPADELEVTARLELAGTPLGEYLQGDRLTVISRVYDQPPIVLPYPEGGPLDGSGAAFVAADRIAGDVLLPPFPYPRESKTVVTVLDVSDRTAPQVVQRTELDGSYVESRRIDDFVYVVTNSGSLSLPRPEITCDQGEQHCRYETPDEYTQRVEQDFESLLEEVLPQYVSFGSAGELVRSGVLVEPEDIFQPLTPDSHNLISVVAIDMANSEPGLASTAGVLTTGATQVYGSLDSLYVFDQHFQWRSEDGWITRILKFDWNRAGGGVDFVATAAVPGQMLNQFSADEFDGHLRIATTISNSYSGNHSGVSENVLFVLRDDTGILELVGSMQNLALEEHIRSVRFFGERAFVVTFRNIDPLFGLDLSDHADPRAVGHLTLPGFASYMQFISEDRLLTVGQNTTVAGSGPVAVSLFNVRDLTEPVLIDQLTLPRFSTSEANTDHHAFGWFAPHDVLAVPSARRFWEKVDEDGDGYREAGHFVQEHELYTFQIDGSADGRSDDGISLLGRVAHDSPVRRSAYIEDKLYAVANASIKVVEMSDPANLVGEAVIDPVPDDPPDGPRPWVDQQIESLERLSDMAQSDLAMQLGVAEDAVMTVAAESAGGAGNPFRLVLRAADAHYVFRSSGEDQVVLDAADFVFAAGGQAYDWHNDDLPLDTNGDRLVTPIDALLVFNELNGRGARRLPSGGVVRQIDVGPTAHVDTSGDGVCSALDALLVINELNRRAAAEMAGPAEGEDAAATAGAWGRYAPVVFAESRSRQASLPAGDDDQQAQGPVERLLPVIVPDVVRAQQGESKTFAADERSVPQDSPADELVPQAGELLVELP